MDDLAPFFGGIVAAALAYIAMRIGNERHFATIEAQQAAQDERINRALEDSRISRELTNTIATLSAKMDDLRDDVSKHNALIERTYVVERDVATAFHRIDELREDIHDMKHQSGGTR